MTNFELWVRGCELNKTILYCLEGFGDTALYKLTSKHLVKNNYIWETPVYIVWIKGEQICATTSYIAAHKIWENRIKDGNRN